MHFCWVSASQACLARGLILLPTGYAMKPLELVGFFSECCPVEQKRQHDHEAGREKQIRGETYSKNNEIIRKNPHEFKKRVSLVSWFPASCLVGIPNFFRIFETLRIIPPLTASNLDSGLKYRDTWLLPHAHNVY